MTNVSDTLRNPQAGSDLAPVRAKSGWIVALGVVYLIAGFVALGSVVMATVASVLVVGVMMIIAGAVGRRRLSSGRGDGRQHVRSAASIIRRLETKHHGRVLN